MRKILIAAGALTLAAPALAQSSPHFPEEMDDEMVRSLPSPREVEDMAETVGRAADAVLDVPIGGVVRAIDPYRRVHPDDTIADISRDPYLRDRVRDSTRDIAIGMGDAAAQIAILAPVLRRSLADLERNLDRAMRESRRHRAYGRDYERGYDRDDDRRYDDDYDYEPRD